MKAPSSEYYTDPIVYKEGFFKDKQDEQAYIDRIARQVERQKAGLVKSGKKPTASRR